MPSNISLERLCLDGRVTEDMPPCEARSPNDEMRSDWRSIAAVIVVIALIVAVIALVLTAPISEIIIFVSNADEDDAARVSIHLGDSATSMDIRPGGMVAWKFHVHPGTHSLRVYSSFDDLSNDTEVFTWTTYVSFNGVNYGSIRVSEEGAALAPLVDVVAGASPLGQALRDPSVITPIGVLSGLHILLAVILWNPSKIKQGKSR